MFQKVFNEMSTYNQSMNNNLIEILMEVPNELIEKDQGVFFSSILGTFQHIMVADLIWLRRFSKIKEFSQMSQLLEEYPEIQSLNDTLYDRFLNLSSKRTELDKILDLFVQSIPEESFSQEFTYQNLSGKNYTKRFSTCLTHMFNHQTHHRGQVTAMLSQNKIDYGATDLVHLID